MSLLCDDRAVGRLSGETTELLEKMDDDDRPGETPDDMELMNSLVPSLLKGASIFRL
jgi:hypothetical protein